MPARHLLVMNPAAGRRHGRDPASVLAAFRRHGLEAELVLTERRGHARDLIRERGEEFDSIVVVGGDGSIHETIQALDLERHRLGLVPWGTGNDFAYALGWPRDLEACIRRIASGSERRVDLGWFEIEHPGGSIEGRFHNSVGFGFEALVNAESHRVQYLKGPAVYVWAFLKTLPRYRSYRIELEYGDHRHSGDVLLFAIGNGRRVGGAFHFFPEASLEDGLLDLLFTDRIPPFRIPAVFSTLMRERHGGAERFQNARAAGFTVRCKDGIPVYVDGEFLTLQATLARLRCLPGVLRTG
jgi:diacylglycerol kinase (ATP)